MIQIYKLRRFVPGNFPTNLITNFKFLNSSHLPKSLQTLRLYNVCWSPKITGFFNKHHRVINTLSSLARAYVGFITKGCIGFTCKNLIALNLFKSSDSYQ